MPTSGSTDYSITAGDMVSKSLRLLQVIKPGATASSDLTTDGLSFLNLLVKSLIADGMPLWTVSSASIALSLNKSSYTIGPSGADVTMERPVKIISARRKDSSDIEVPVTMISRDEYDNIPLKTSDGKILNVYYDPQLGNGTMYVWPRADDITDTLEITYQRTFEDFDSASDTPDFPQEWYLALIYGLADILSDAYPVDPKIVRKINAKAFELKEHALNWSVEDDSIFFQPRMS